MWSRISPALAMVVALTQLVRADAELREWVGVYNMNHDGHVGRLIIVDSGGPCRVPWCGLELSYSPEGGARIPARIVDLDQARQHMTFFIDFPGNRQRFDAYLMSWDKTTLAGTTVWNGRTFGFYAVKTSGRAPASRTRVTGPTAPMRGASQPSATPAARSVLPDGTVQTIFPDGSKMLTRPGDCTKTFVTPDGQSQRMLCSTQTQPATMPDLPGAAVPWFNAHSDSLLSIVRSLFGGDSASVSNYLANYEANQPDIYTRVKLRTELIEQLTSAR